MGPDHLRSAHNWSERFSRHLMDGPYAPSTRNCRFQRRQSHSKPTVKRRCIKNVNTYADRKCSNDGAGATIHATRCCEVRRHVALRFSWQGPRRQTDSFAPLPTVSPVASVRRVLRERARSAKGSHTKSSLEKLTPVYAEPSSFARLLADHIPDPRH